MLLDRRPILGSQSGCSLEQPNHTDHSWLGQLLGSHLPAEQKWVAPAALAALNLGALRGLAGRRAFKIPWLCGKGLPGSWHQSNSSEVNTTWWLFGREGIYGFLEGMFSVLQKSQGTVWVITKLEIYMPEKKRRNALAVGNKVKSIVITINVVITY